jgi:carbamate kinase
MRVVAALGGNALLRRGEPLTAENQRSNVARACAALAPIAREHQLVISHGNGPQVGLLALQGSAYAKVETSHRLDRRRAEAAARRSGLVLAAERPGPLRHRRRSERRKGLTEASG